MSVKTLAITGKMSNLNEEFWKDIQGFEGCYQVSNLGRIKSLPRYRVPRERILCPNTDSRGYQQVKLRDNTGQHSIRVHRLVAMSFVNGYSENLVVNHIDENQQNNRWDNLEWVTFTQNINHGTSQVRKAKHHNRRVTNGLEIFDSIKEGSLSTGVNPVNITAVCKGKRKTAGGYEWRYLDDN